MAMTERDDLADALTDNWPDTSVGWLTYADKYEFAGAFLDTITKVGFTIVPTEDYERIQKALE